MNFSNPKTLPLFLDGLCIQGLFNPIGQALIPAEYFHFLVHIRDKLPTRGNDLICGIEELYVFRI